jgi:hypothetical protein
MTFGNTEAEMMAEILPDISFPCYVRGKQLTATLTHIEDQYIRNIYSVSFSDGYKTRILGANDATDKIWIDLNNEEDNLHTPELGYVEAVKEDLVLFSLYQPLGDVCLIVMDLPNENDVKVWALKPEESNDYYIHYQGQCRFTMERTEEGWQTDPINESESDLDFVKKLSRFIASKIDERVQ